MHGTASRIAKPVYSLRDKSAGDNKPTCSMQWKSFLCDSAVLCCAIPQFHKVYTISTGQEGGLASRHYICGQPVHQIVLLYTISTSKMTSEWMELESVLLCRPTFISVPSFISIVAGYIIDTIYGYTTTPAGIKWKTRLSCDYLAKC